MRGPALALIALLSGCAKFDPQGSFGAVEKVARDHLGKDVAWIRSEDDARRVRDRVDQLLAKPLTADSAVQVALLNNRDLQAAYGDLGISEARLVQASLPPVPGLTAGRQTRGGIVEVELQITLNILAILTLPARIELERRRHDQVKLQAANQMLRVAGDARRAFYRTVAAREASDYVDRARTSAEAAADIGKQLGDTGAWSKLNQARGQLFYAESVAQSATVKQRYASERENLYRLLGVWEATSRVQLPGKLPVVPARARSSADMERRALEQRLDIRIAKAELEGLAQSLGLTKATRFVNAFEAGYLRTTETGEPVKKGFEVELSIPIYDFGQSRVQHAEEQYMQAVNRLAALAIRVRSEVRNSYQIHRTSHELARHYGNEILPIRKIVTDESQLRYNGMLIDTFELLADARQQIRDIVGYIEATRDFWLADVDLQAALIGGGSPNLGSVGSSLTSPAAGAGGTGGH